MKRNGVVDLSPVKQIELELRESNAYVYCPNDLSICKKLRKMMIYHAIFYKPSIEKTSTRLTLVQVKRSGVVDSSPVK